MVKWAGVGGGSKRPVRARAATWHHQVGPDSAGSAASHDMRAACRERRACGSILPPSSGGEGTSHASRSAWDRILRHLFNQSRGYEKYGKQVNGTTP